jgi:pilus assembly protein CpaE
MNVFLISEDESIADSIRQILMREGVDCPISSQISFGQATRRLSTVAADLIVAVLPDDPLQSVEALDVLAAVARSDRTLVIAVGPAADAKLVIRALRGVVDDYVDLSDLEPELVAVLATWRKRCFVDRPEGRLIAVLAPSGGAGSSTIAASLAVQAAKDLKSVALLDMKLETGDLAALLDLKPTYSLADLCKNIDRLDQVFFERSLVRHASGVQLLSSPKHLADVNIVTLEGIRQTIWLAQTSFPFVVVDMDHGFDDEQLHVLRHADLILLVLRLDFTSLKNATKFLEHLDGLGVRMDRVRLVVNRSGQPSEVPLAKVEAALKSKVFHLLPDDPKVVNRANNNGVPVILDSPSSKFSKSLVKLTQAILATPRPEGGKEINKAEKAPSADLSAISPRDLSASRLPPEVETKPKFASAQAPPRVSNPWRS